MFPFVPIFSNTYRSVLAILENISIHQDNIKEKFSYTVDHRTDLGIDFLDLIPTNKPQGL